MREAVVTIVSGRHEHLRRQRRSLMAGTRMPDVHVVVSMGDADVRSVVDDGLALRTEVIELPMDGRRMPLSEARNAGAAAALRHGARALIFLDVDCLASQDLVAGYGSALAGAGSAVLSGTVTYLPPGPAEGWRHRDLPSLRQPHPARPDPAPGAPEHADPVLFWSLSFACTAQTWVSIGGFDERYRGYGGEDTDFAQRVRAADVSLLWIAGADAFHQHHWSADPPVQHLDDLLANGEQFASAWGWWPMRGWFEQLAQAGMVVPRAGGWARADPVRLLSVPARHPYLDAIRPAHVVPIATERVRGWEPDPALEPSVLRQLAHDVDAIHVHIGYDHLAPEHMRAWLDAVRESGLPLVVTVHDLRNPHHVDRGLHDLHLALLLREAQAAITLTEGAARELLARFGVRAEVIDHPCLVGEAAPRAATEHGLVGVHLKEMRRNTAPPQAVVEATARAARDVGGRLRVDVHREAIDRPELAFLRGRCNPEVEVAVHDRFDDSELLEYLAACHASVLPYLFGTHSGWLELCRDVGTRVIAPDCGYYADQWADVVSFACNEQRGLDERSLARAVAVALAAPPPPAADPARRRGERDVIRMRHAAVYTRVRA